MSSPQQLNGAAPSAGSAGTHDISGRPIAGATAPSLEEDDRAEEFEIMDAKYRDPLYKRQKGYGRLLVGMIVFALIELALTAAGVAVTYRSLNATLIWTLIWSIITLATVVVLWVYVRKSGRVAIAANVGAHVLFAVVWLVTAAVLLDRELRTGFQDDDSLSARRRRRGLGSAADGVGKAGDVSSNFGVIPAAVALGFILMLLFICASILTFGMMRLVKRTQM